MSEFFAEATVRLTPDLTGFVQQLKTEVKAAVEKIEGTPGAKIKISPALTRDFVGSLRKQVNIAVAQAQRGVKPIQVRAVLSDTSRAAIAREIRTGAQTVRATTPVAAARAAVPAAPAGAKDAITTLVGATRAEKLLADAERSRIPILGQVTAAQTASNKARQEGVAASRQIITATEEETAATTQLAHARLELAAATKLEAGSAAFTRRVRNADAAALDVLVAAEQSGSQATQRAAQAFREQIRTLPGASAALDETSRAARQAASNMSQLRRGVLSTSLSFLGIRGATLAASARFLAGAAAIAVFAKALQSSAAFAQQLSVFQATTGATGDELDRVRESARALGADLSLPGVTAGDAAEAMTELAKAGLSVEDALAGARGVLQLATAAAIDNAQATELAANAINAFGLAGRDATHVADVFANAANAAQGSIVDIGIAFQQASAAGRQVGLSFEDTSTFLTVLARNGLKGSDAGTSLRTALIRLVKPTDEAAAKLKQLGVETRDAAGNLRPDIFIQLTQAVKDLTPAQRDATLALVGGQDAFRAITILGRQSIQDFIRLRRELRQQGTAADLAKARMTGLRGSIEGLGNTLSSVGIRAGTRLTPALQGVVEGITGVTVSMANSDRVAQGFSGTVEFLEITFGALATTLQTIVPIVTQLSPIFGSLPQAIGVPTILAGIVAYKGLGLALTGIEAARTGPIVVAFERLRLQIGLLKLEGAASGMRALGAAMTAAAFSTVGITIALAAAAAAIFFLVTRETAAERATRKLKEATEGLITAQEKLNQSRTAQRDTGLQQNAARLAVFNAQVAQLTARNELANSNAARGSFARTKLELQLAVALDNVKIAQNNLTDAVTRATQAREEAVQAAANEKVARQEEVGAIARQIATESALVRLQGRGGVNAQRTQEAAAVERITEDLRKRIQVAREENTVESRALADRLQLLVTISALLQKIPSNKAVDIAINAPNTETALNKLIVEFGVAGTKAGTILEQALRGELTKKLQQAFANLDHTLSNLIKPPFQSVGDNALGAFVTGFNLKVPDAAAEMARNLVQQLANEIKGLQGQAAGLQVAENLATIASGATGARLPALQAELANARKREADARRAIAASPVGETPNLRKALRQAIADQASIITQIRGINDQLASDAKSAADEAKTKQDQIFENILKAMGIKRDRRQQAIENAQLTDTLADDLAATRKLRAVAAQQLKNLRERIKAARAQGKNVKVLVDGLHELTGIWRDLGREVKSLQAERQKQIQDRVAEANQLDIEDAQLRGNRAAEIRARLREIARLKHLQDLTRKGSIEWRRLRNLIDEQKKAIEDATTATKSLFAELSFNFLTTQQGFAANLLGNLLPLGAIGNTVAGNLASASGSAAEAVTGSNFDRGGNPTHRLPGTAGRPGVRSAATAAQADTVANPTRGQQSTVITLLREILRTLRSQHEATKHPSSKRQQRQTNASLETRH